MTGGKSFENAQDSSYASVNDVDNDVYEGREEEDDDVFNEDEYG